MGIKNLWETRPQRWVIILVGCLLLLAMIFSAARLFTGMASEKVYPDLAQPGETEAPSTFTSYLSSEATEAIIGGQGTGLNCSIPKVMETVAFKTAKDGSDISLRFRQACVMHDLCYRHGYATYGYTQADCDSQLQQSAYRLCRQIGNQNSGKAPSRSGYAACEHEAKEVLLGVTLGGAGSFHSRRSSTYFEYDPQPARADDYIVGRAVPEGIVSDPARDFGVRTFYFRRNTVKMRVLAATPETSSVDVVPFPGALVATPPMLTGIAEGEGATLPPLVALARRSFSETSVHLVPFTIANAAGRGKASRMLTLPDCPDDACSLDADASINKFAVIEGRPVMVSLTHRGTLSSSKTTVKIEQNAFLNGSAVRLNNYSLNGSHTAIHNQYRFLSHDMLLEKDDSGRITHAWTFARGVLVSADGKQFVRDNSGKDYASHVAVARQRLGSNRQDDIQRFSLDAKETDEPLSLIRLGKEKGVALVGLAWSSEDLKRVESGKPAKSPPLLKIWRLPQNGAAPNPEPQALGVPVPLPNGYISLPPMIVRLTTQDAPLMIMTRVAADRWQSGENQPKPTVSTDTLAIDFFITSLTGDGPLNFANSYQLRCELGLDKQLQSPEARSLRQRAYRNLFGRYNAALEANNPPWQIDAIKSDLAQRWRMSQTIVSERQLETEGAVMALTMVFNGFPAMSFQVLLKPGNDGLRYLPSPAGPRFLNQCALKALPEANAGQKGSGKRISR